MHVRLGGRCYHLPYEKRVDISNDSLLQSCSLFLSALFRRTQSSSRESSSPFRSLLRRRVGSVRNDDTLHCTAIEIWHPRGVDVIRGHQTLNDSVTKSRPMSPTHVDHIPPTHPHIPVRSQGQVWARGVYSTRIAWIEQMNRAI